MLFKVVSILVACTTSQATAPGRSVRNLGKAEDALKKLEARFDFHPSTFESKINAEKFGLKLKQPIGKWLGKFITILSFVGMFGGLCFGLYNSIYGMLEEIIKWLNESGYAWEVTLINTGYVPLLLTNCYGYWRVEKARNAYLIMLGFDIAAIIVYGIFVIGRVLGKIPNNISIIDRIIVLAAQLFLAAVFLFNWYKVLFPAWTGFGDW